MGHVLVVDDDPVMTALIELHLHRRGHTALIANSAEDAIGLVKAAEIPDVVVLDVVMPDMNGFRLLAALRAETNLPTLPAIFLSGQITDSDVATGTSMGAVYLTKPFIASALLATVDRLIDGAGLELTLVLEERMAESLRTEQPLVLSARERTILNQIAVRHHDSQSLRALLVLSHASQHHQPV